MSNLNDNPNENERALEALLAMAFAQSISEEISDEEATKLFQKPARLSKEDEEAINSWGTDFIEELIEGKKTILHGYNEEVEVDGELSLECIGMNRDKNGNDLDEETIRKIDEERRKALEEENNKNNGSNHES